MNITDDGGSMYKGSLGFVIVVGVLCSVPSSPARAQGRGPASRNVPLMALHSAGNTQFQKPVRELVRDSATFRRLWREMLTSDSMPRIDFRRSVVILIALGTRPTTGYEVHVRALRATGNELHVFLDLIEPGGECPVGAEVGSPATILEAMLRVPASSPPKVLFHDRKLVLQCSND